MNLIIMYSSTDFCYIISPCPNMSVSKFSPVTLSLRFSLGVKDTKYDTHAKYYVKSENMYLLYMYMKCSGSIRNRR